jgi:hypothetical protein
VRRSFSPPFVKEPETGGMEIEPDSCQKRLDFVQVQKTDVFHDSLDDIPKPLVQLIDSHHKSMQKDAKVVNEAGQLLDVIFDPVLKCYYEPTKNQYYALKDI